MEVMHDHNYMYYINIMIPDMFHIYQNLYHSLGTLQFLCMVCCLGTNQIVLVCTCGFKFCEQAQKNE